MNPRDAGFNAHERVELLTEIIKAGNVQPDMLLQFIRSHGVQPDWGNVALPRGRTLNQCMNWFNSVMPQVSGPISGLVRSQSVRDPDPSSALKRPFNPDQSAFGGRPIIPKPPMTNIGNILNEQSLEPPKKKRGRPTKAELEARKEAALARGEILKAPIREHSVMAGPSSIAAVAAQAAMTPRVPEQLGSGSTGASESSSGSKKRGRPSKADIEARQLQEEARALEVRATPTRYPNILSPEGDKGGEGGGGPKRPPPSDSASRPDSMSLR